MAASGQGQARPLARLGARSVRFVGVHIGTECLEQLSTMDSPHSEYATDRANRQAGGERARQGMATGASRCAIASPGLAL